MNCTPKGTTGTMSQNSEPRFAFGNPQANGAQEDDEFGDGPQAAPAPELLAVAAAQPPAAATPQTQQQASSSQQPPPPPTTLSAEAENRLLDRLLSSLQTMGITQQRPATPAASVSQPEAQPEQEAEQDPWANWKDPWTQDGSNSGWNWNSGNWQSPDWNQ